MLRILAFFQKLHNSYRKLDKGDIKMATILLANEYSIEQRGLRSFLENEPDLKIVGEVGNTLPAIKMMAEKLRPDILITDLDPSEKNGIEICREVSRCSPKTSIILITTHELDKHVADALQAGVRAYVLKKSVVDELMRAVRSVRSGWRYLSMQLAGMTIDYYINNYLFSKEHPDKILTPREFEIFSLLAEAYDNRDIANRLSINVRTVECHCYHITHKLGVKKKSQLIKYALKQRTPQVLEPFASN
jgi:two-component system, NarL family, response regulator NreC